MIMVELMIDQYFRSGFKYEKIIALLERFHGVEVTLRSLYQLLVVVYINYTDPSLLPAPFN